MGLEFMNIFDRWAESYDETVFGHGEEYKEVFEDYEQILREVADKSRGTVVEFGVGTGNLTAKLLAKGHKVYGIEPSEAMRKQTKQKFPDLKIFDGDFLNIPSSVKEFDTIVSTYAFHHLTDSEKAKAVNLYQQLLPAKGKIVFADTVFLSIDAKNETIKKAEQQEFYNLAKDLKTEYYTTIEVLKEIFHSNGFEVSFTKLNTYVWLIDAAKVNQEVKGDESN